MASASDLNSTRNGNHDHCPVKPLPRKLPPIPQPPVAPKRTILCQPPVIIPHTVQDNDEDSPYENVEDIEENTDINSIEESDAIIVSSTANNLEQFAKPIVEIQENLDEIESETSMKTPEPTYASINKPLSPKVESTNMQYFQDDEDEYKKEEIAKSSQETVDLPTTPPPIPLTRPPLEDYEGILPGKELTPGVPENYFENNDVFDTNYNTLGDNAEATKENVEVGNDLYPSKSHENEDISKNEKNASADEPPYETVKFNSKSTSEELRRAPPPPAPRKQHPPKPKERPPPRPQVNSVSSTDTTSNLEDKPLSPTVVRRETNASKGINLIKRKSQQIKKKSLSILKPLVNNDGKESTSASTSNTTKKNSKSNAPAKAKSFSSAHNRQLAVNQSETKTIAKPVNLSRHQSTPACKTDKPKRTPPPRPAMSVALQQKLLSPGPNSRETKKPSSPISPACSLPSTSSCDRRTSESSTCIVSPKSNAGSSDLDDLDDIFYPPEEVTQTTVLSPHLKSPKPNRPPPMQDEHIKIPIKPSKQSESKAKESFFDVIKQKDEKKKPKSNVDEKMKHYISDELYYVATEDYRPSNFTDLTFCAGEKILVLKKIDDDLLFGRNEEGEEGPFPKKCVCLEFN